MKKIDQIKKSTILNCGYAKGISVLEVMRKFKQNSKKILNLKSWAKEGAIWQKLLQIHRN